MFLSFFYLQFGRFFLSLYPCLCVCFIPCIPVHSNVYSNQSHNAVPAAPNVVTAHKASSTSIRVLWNPVLPESVHGILRGYNISYMPRGSLDNSWVDKTVDTNTTSTIIWGLKRYSPYLVQVFGFNGKEEGVPSKAITAWTDEDGENFIYLRESYSLTGLSLLGRPPSLLGFLIY